MTISYFLLFFTYHHICVWGQITFNGQSCCPTEIWGHSIWLAQAIITKFSKHSSNLLILWSHLFSRYTEQRCFFYRDKKWKFWTYMYSPEIISENIVIGAVRIPSWVHHENTHNPEHLLLEVANIRNIILNFRFWFCNSNFNMYHVCKYLCS